jgi:hypothetical protein
MCDQRWENCFLITACEFVDLQMQRDLNLTEAEKLQCFDKSQADHQTMSTTDLVSYAVENSGNSGLQVSTKLLGASVALQFHLHTDLLFGSAQHIDDSLFTQCQKSGWIVYVTFNSNGFKAVNNHGNGNPCKIPCFDAFDKPLVKWLCLDTEASSKKAWLETQMQSQPLTPVKRLFPGSSAMSLDTIPSMQESLAEISTADSLEAPYSLTAVMGNCL